MSFLNSMNFIIRHPLNRGSKLSSVLRFVKWQVGSRLIGGAVVYDWVNGSRFFVRTGETGLTQNIYTGLQEFPDMAFLLHFLRGHDLFVDVGANAGSYTILAGAVVGARCIAFEPVPRTYERLVDNMRLNRLDEKVECVNKGVGAESGKIAFTSGCGTANHALASGEKGNDSITVEITRLDTALHGQSPTLIKIDVEGYETPVLEGGQETLKAETLRCVIMELNGHANRYGYRESLLLELMQDHGFRAYSYNPLDRALIELNGKNQSGSNTLFIRDVPYVTERVNTSPKVTVNGRMF
jgi:FkbM family methyltransferase